MRSARQLAWRTLLDVERGAHSTDLLTQRLDGLDSRDANLTTELVLGVLRRRAQLDWFARKQSRRTLEKLDLEVLTAIRLGIYQLRFLDRIPAHAAIHESVEIVKSSGFRSAAGMVNAILRRLEPLPSSFDTAWEQYSMPEWLWARWVEHYGEEAARAAATAALRAPETYVRSAQPGPGLEATEIPGCYRLTGALQPPALKQTRYQDIGSQAIVPELQLEPGLRFLDVCAAPGNKTLQALEAGVRAVACDRSWARLTASLLQDVDRVVADARRPLPFDPIFDRVLVDAPCSGTGTLARNPEIRWRLQPQDLAVQAARQTAILRHALACLKPGGLLVYSTCSLEPEENQQVVAAVCPERVVRQIQRLPGREPGEGFYSAVIR